MKYKGRNNKSKFKKNFHKVIIYFIIIYFLISSSKIFFSLNNKLVYPEDYSWNYVKETRGILIKNEYIIPANNELEIGKIATEGTRVSVGDRIAEFKSEDRLRYLRNKLNQINESIETLSKIGTSETVDRELEGNSNLSLSEITLESLEREKENLTSQINNSLKSYTADVSGLLSYKLDGYEKVLIPNKFENYTFEEIDKLYKFKDSHNDTKNHGIKIIDNFVWFIALQLDSGTNISNYKNNDKILLYLPDLNLDFEGRVIEINETNEGAVLILEFNKNLHDFYDLRFLDANIIIEKKKGYKIPLQSIYDHDYQQGVLCKDFIGNIIFKPIIVLDEEDGYAIVDKGDEKGYIRVIENSEKYKTISLYDEIILNPSRVKSNLILN